MGYSFKDKKGITINIGQIYKYMISILKNIYLEKLDGIAMEYNNAYHRTIKIKPVDVKPNMCLGFNKENNR